MYFTRLGIYKSHIHLVWKLKDEGVEGATTVVISWEDTERDRELAHTNRSDHLAYTRDMARMAFTISRLKMEAKRERFQVLSGKIKSATV